MTRTPEATASNSVPLGPVAGFADLTLARAEQRRRLDRMVCDEIEAWGYRPVSTPLLEDAELLRATLGSDPQLGLMKLIDADGRVLTLVGERTVPVARVVAGQLSGQPMPLRLFYSAPVVGPSRRGGLREGHQVGAELLGATGAAADAEVVALAARSLEVSGLDSLHLDVGHAGFFRGLIEGLAGQGDLQAQVLAALAARDFVALDHALESTPLRSAEHELIRRFPTLRGGPEILEAARLLATNATTMAALKELAAVHEVLTWHGLGNLISLDLGAIRDFNYYTGVIFEAFSSDHGAPVAAGGRYDQLMTQLGTPTPASGFVIHMERLEEALGEEAAPTPGRPATAIVGHAPGHLAHAVAFARELRRLGVRTQLELQPGDVAGLHAAARAQKADWAFHAATPLRGGLSSADFLAELDEADGLALASASRPHL